MIHHIFCIFDQKAAAHLPPFILPRKEMAERTFADCCNKEGHQFQAHPEDYTLMRLGTFDDETANIDTLPVPEVLGLGVKYVVSGGEPERLNGSSSFSNESQVLGDT